MCLVQVSGTLLIYINTPIALFGRAIFSTIFAFLFQLQQYISAQAKPPFLPVKKQDHCLMTQWEEEIFAKCLGRIHFEFQAACMHVF